MLYFQKFHIYLISDSQNIFHSLYMAMCQFGDVEKALFSRYDFNKSSVLFNRLHRTVVGGTFVQMACNRLNPLLRSFSFRSEEHTSELQSRGHLVCRLLLEKKNKSGIDGAQGQIAQNAVSGDGGGRGARAW